MLKTTGNKKKKYNKIVRLAISKLNSIESKTSESVINNEISHEEFSWQLLMKKKIYWGLQKRIRMMNSQRIDTENINIIEEGKK